MVTTAPSPRWKLAASSACASAASALSSRSSAPPPRAGQVRGHVEQRGDGPAGRADRVARRHRRARTVVHRVAVRRHAPDPGEGRLERRPQRRILAAGVEQRGAGAERHDRLVDPAPGRLHRSLVARLRAGSALPDRLEVALTAQLVGQGGGVGRQGHRQRAPLGAFPVAQGAGHL
jgi:hypothetical protein